MKPYIEHFYDVDEFIKAIEILRPQPNKVSNKWLKHVCQVYRTSNLKTIEERRKNGQQLRKMENNIGFSFYGRVVEMTLTFTVSDDGLRLNPRIAESVRFIRKRLDSIFN